jgi:hypothetical protein
MKGPCKPIEGACIQAPTLARVTDPTVDPEGVFAIEPESGPAACLPVDGNARPDVSFFAMP